MHLVFIQKATGRGGAKNRLLDTLSALQADPSFKLSVIVGEPQGEFLDHCRAMGIEPIAASLPEWRKPLQRLRFSRAMKALATRFFGQKVDWVISNEMWWGPHAARLAKLLDAKSATILRDGIATVAKANKYHLYENDLILPSSTKIANGLAPDARLKERTLVFYDSVRLPATRGHLAADLDATLAKHPDVRRWFVVLGKVGPRKRQADAVRVIHHLKSADLGLLLAGDCEADYGLELNRVIEACGLTDRVVRLGNFSDILTLFDRAEAVLLTSTREGLPGSVVEALLAGKPCFVYPCEGVTDIYGDQLSRFVSENFDPAELAARIVQAGAEPAALQLAVLELQARATAMFSPAAHLAQCQLLFT